MLWMLLNSKVHEKVAARWASSLDGCIPTLYSKVMLHILRLLMAKKKCPLLVCAICLQHNGGNDLSMDAPDFNSLRLILSSWFEAKNLWMAAMGESLQPAHARNAYQRFTSTWSEHVVSSGSFQLLISIPYHKVLLVVSYSHNQLDRAS